MNGQMETAFLVAVLGGSAVYLCLARRFLPILFGFLLLSNAANLVVLAMSGNPTGAHAAIVESSTAAGVAVDPLPQALILTAIVIGFSVAAYLNVLLYRIYVDNKSATLIGIEREQDADGKETRS